MRVEIQNNDIQRHICAVFGIVRHTDTVALDIKHYTVHSTLAYSRLFSGWLHLQNRNRRLAVRVRL